MTRFWDEVDATGRFELRQFGCVLASAQPSSRAAVRTLRLWASKQDGACLHWRQFNRLRVAWKRWLLRFRVPGYEAKRFDQSIS